MRSDSDTWEVIKIPKITIFLWDNMGMICLYSHITLGRRKEYPLIRLPPHRTLSSVNYLGTVWQYSCGASEAALNHENMQYFLQYHCEVSKLFCNWQEVTKPLGKNSVPRGSQISVKVLLFLSLCFIHVSSFFLFLELVHEYLCQWSYCKDLRNTTKPFPNVIIMLLLSNQILKTFFNI